MGVVTWSVVTCRALPGVSTDKTASLSTPCHVRILNSRPGNHVPGGLCYLRHCGEVLSLPLCVCLSVKAKFHYAIQLASRLQTS